MTDYSIITVTYPNKESAKAAAKLLVQRKLAACVQLLPIESVYSWQGEICDENEVLLLIKTKKSMFPEIESFIKSNHSYDVPEIIQVPIENGFRDYLDWIEGEVDEPS